MRQRAGRRYAGLVRGFLCEHVFRSVEMTDPRGCVCDGNRTVLVACVSLLLAGWSACRGSCTRCASRHWDTCWTTYVIVCWLSQHAPFFLQRAAVSHIVRGYLLKGPAGGRYMRWLICLVSAFWLGVFMTLTCTAHRTAPDVKGLPYPVCSCLGLIPLSMSMTMVFPRQFAPFSRPLLSRGLTIGRRIRTCISHSFWASG